MRHDVFDGLSCDPSSFQIDFTHMFLEPEVLLRNYGRVKGVRLDDIGASLQVVPMNFLDNLRVRKTEDLVIVFEVDRMIGKAGASIILLAKLKLLDHGPECAIEDQDPARHPVPR